MQHRDVTAADRGGVQVGAVAARLGADQAHGVVAEGVEGADRVGAAADAGHHDVREPPRLRQHLRARLAPDHRLQLAHERGVGVRAGRRADQVVRRLDVGDPVADGLVHGLLERRRAGRDRDDGGAEQVHARDVGRLAARVLLAHVDDALHAEARAHGRARDAVLARARLGHDALLAEPLREQRLADGVVDLVRARVREVLALEPDARAADLGAEPLGQVERRLAPDVVARERGQLGREGRVGEGGGERRLELVERRHHGLGHEAPAEAAEAPERVRRVLHVEALAVSCSSRLLGRGDQPSHALVVLDSRGALDAARAVDAVRAHLAHRLRDVLGVEPARQQQRIPVVDQRAGERASARTAPRCRASRPRAGRR